MKDNFKFPSPEQVNKIYGNMVKILPFRLAYQYGINSLMNNESTLEEIKRENHLQEWNYVFASRITKLNFAFIYAMAYYEWSLKEEIFFNLTTTNQFLLEFYIESFYNLYFTTVEIIAQIVNVNYNINKEEDDVSWNKLKKAGVSAKVLAYFEEFKKNYELAKEIRNSFNHRFPGNVKDLRLEFNYTNPGYEIAPLAKVLLPENFISNMETSMQSLAIFTVHLQGELGS